MFNSLQGRECEIVFEHLRKDTISREGSFFYQPLSLTLSSAFARIKTHTFRLSSTVRFVHPWGGKNV